MTYEFFDIETDPIQLDFFLILEFIKIFKKHVLLNFISQNFKLNLVLFVLIFKKNTMKFSTPWSFESLE